MPLTDEYKRRLQHKQNRIKVIDLRNATQPSEIYECEYCNTRLIPYHDVEGKRLTRGKLWQCGRCGQIKDTAMDNLQHPATLTSRGDNNDNIFFKQIRQQSITKKDRIDFDKGDDLMYKGQGFTIMRTRIVSGDGRVLRDDNNSL